MLFVASTESQQIQGHDDYKSLFNLINLGLEKRDNDIYGIEVDGNNLTVQASDSRNGWGKLETFYLKLDSLNIKSEPDEDQA